MGLDRNNDHQGMVENHLRALIINHFVGGTLCNQICVWLTSVVGNVVSNPIILDYDSSEDADALVG